MISGIGALQSGLEAFSRQMAVSSDNLANIQTPGFKSRRATLRSLASGGSTVDSVTISREAGGLVQTGNPLDIGIVGQGFFNLALPNGKTGFSRSGNFQKNARGQLTDSRGNPLQPAITIPGNATGLSIDRAGQVAALVGGRTNILGQINLSTFPNPDGLTPAGDNLFLPTSASGSPLAGTPGSGGRGALLSGFLEASNVNILGENINMMVAGNGFKAAAKAIKTQDEVLGSLLDLKA